MYNPAENPRRRDNVIAGLTAALVGVAMIVLAGKASATDLATAHDHATTTIAMETANADESAEGDKEPVATAIDAHGTHAQHASHEDHDGATGSRHPQAASPPTDE